MGGGLTLLPREQPVLAAQMGLFIPIAEMRKTNNREKDRNSCTEKELGAERLSLPTAYLRVSLTP